jgi:hypothetical protein
MSFGLNAIVALRSWFPIRGARLALHIDGSAVRIPERKVGVELINPEAGEWQ